MKTNDVTELSLKSKGPKDYASRSINPWRMEAIKKYAGKSILDIGCGSGAYVLSLAEKYEIHGVDYCEFETWEQNRHLFSIADASKIDVADSSVDTILSFETLEHLQDPMSALREYARVTRKNIILTVPNCDLTPGFIKSNLLFSHWSDVTHKNFFNMKSITEIVTEAGFVVTNKYYINPINFGPAIMESLGVKGYFAHFGAGIFKILQRRKYFLTCLVVAQKINSN